MIFFSLVGTSICLSVALMVIEWVSLVIGPHVLYAEWSVGMVWLSIVWYSVCVCMYVCACVCVCCWVSVMVL